MRELKLILITLTLAVISSTAFVTAQSTLPYNEVGIVYENGDSSWDQSEQDLIQFQLFEGETLEIEFFADSNVDLFLMYGYLYSLSDVVTAFNTINDGGNANSVLDSALTASGEATLEYTASQDIDGNLAILSYTDNPSTMTYTVYSSFPSGDRGVDVSSQPVTSQVSIPIGGLQFEVSGTIRENGDEYWDSNEYDTISYTIPAGETFYAEIETSPDAELFILYGNIDTDEHIEEALNDLVNYGESDRILTGTYTENGYAVLTYSASSSITENLVIFSYNTNNPSSMSYTVYTNIESASGPGIGTIILWIVGIIAVIVIIRKLVSKPKRPVYSDAYQQPGSYNSSYGGGYQQGFGQQNQGYQQGYSQQRPDPNKSSYSQGSYEPESKVPGGILFCANCGSKADATQKFCNSCGTRLEDY